MSNRDRFKNQYRDDQWKRLTENKDFTLAWDANDLDTAGRLADQIIYGVARNSKERKNLKLRKIAEDTFY